MGLLFQSHDDRLRLTGVPVRFYEGHESKQAGLVVNFMTVSNAEGQVIGTGYEAEIPLSAEWRKLIQSAKFGANDQMVLELEKIEPSNSVDRHLMQVLAGEGRSLYDIKAFRTEPNPMAAYR